MTKQWDHLHFICLRGIAHHARCGSNVECAAEAGCVWSLGTHILSRLARLPETRLFPRSLPYFDEPCVS
jgi:hypothetical protein